MEAELRSDDFLSHASRTYLSGLSVDLLRMVEVSWVGIVPAVQKKPVRRNQNILALVSKKEASNVFFAVDDLIVIQEVSANNQVLTRDSVVELVNNGRF